MKIIVIKKAWYAGALLKEGQVTEFTGDKPPSWGRAVNVKNKKAEEAKAKAEAKAIAEAEAEAKKIAEAEAKAKAEAEALELENLKKEAEILGIEVKEDDTIDSLTTLIEAFVKAGEADTENE